MIDCSNYNPGLTLTCFTTMSNYVTYAFLYLKKLCLFVWGLTSRLYEKVKAMYFSETIAACDLKDIYN